MFFFVCSLVLKMIFRCTDFLFLYFFTEKVSGERVLSSIASPLKAWQGKRRT